MASPPANRSSRAPEFERRALLVVVATMGGAAVAAAFGVPHPIVAALLVLVPYGIVFGAIALAFRLPEASNTIARLTTRLR